MHFLPQHNYVNTVDGTMGMDFIGRFETLDKDVSDIAAKLGIPAKPPHLDAAPSRSHYQKYFDSETADIIGYNR